MQPPDELDALLKRSEPDSSDWADGGGHERASELLLAFSEGDWVVLQGLVPRRDERWRGCLAAALTPQQGAAARQLLLALACDAETEAAFVAATSVAFHCGVNDGPSGPFIDRATRDSAMLHDARVTPSLVVALRRLGADCEPRFQRRFELLLDVLLGRPSGSGN